jgi:hypothetical protein
MEAVKPEMVNACWWTLWSKCADDFNVFTTTENKVRRTVQVVRQVKYDGFVDILKEGTEELIEGHQETLTKYYIVTW